MSFLYSVEEPASTAEPARVPPAALEAPPQADLIEAVFDALPIGISVHAEDGLCIYRNAAAVRLGVAEGTTASAEPAQPVDLTAGTLLEASGPTLPHDFNLVTETRVKPLRLGDAHYALRTVQDVTAQRRTERELFDRAFLDDLTGLPNRALLQQSLETLISQAGPDTTFAIAFIDLDNFKHINDYYSHAVGDALLYKLGARLSDMLRPNELLARIGGDEFMLLMTPFSGVERLQADIDGVVDRLKQPFFIDGHEIFASASIGVSIFPDHGRSYDTLRRNADSAMYRVKSGVKGGAILFNQSMGHAATARMALEQRLRLAIRDRRFCCAVQPKVDIRTQDVTGVEVLLRWRDEQGLDSGPGRLRRPRGRTRPDGRDHLPRPQRDDAGHRRHRRGVRVAHLDQPQRRGQAGRGRRLHDDVYRSARGDRLPRTLLR